MSRLKIPAGVEEPDRDGRGMIAAAARPGVGMGHGQGQRDGSMGLEIGDRAGGRQGREVWEEHNTTE